MASTSSLSSLLALLAPKASPKAVAAGTDADKTFFQSLLDLVGKKKTDDALAAALGARDDIGANKIPTAADLAGELIETLSLAAEKNKTRKSGVHIPELQLPAALQAYAQVQSLSDQPTDARALLDGKTGL